MSLEFIIDNREIEIQSFNKNFDATGKGWGSIFKIVGNDKLSEIGLAKEFYFKCDNASYGTYTLELKEEDAYRPLIPPRSWQQVELFSLLRESVASGKAYF